MLSRVQLFVIPWTAAHLKKSYVAQNSLELKLPSGSSPPFYAKQRTLSPEGGKNGLKVYYTQLPASPASGQSPEFLASAV